ncbi:GNAT family N-acetyltransferase [Marinilactibacillus kalidii]|uniref:GNAT family N-acetyltransferase n=1 Tax=Marinilactibacillus kalidii TaxID=2820274 RepID=UPI001ABEB05A|nr:GNAT family protein [Marinilactibacillus kalidii]
MYTDKELTIRPIEISDLPRLWALVFKEEAPEWKQWDAPYYPHKRKSYETFLETADDWVNQKDSWAIEVAGEFVGVVTYYWEHEPSKWLECGIVLYESGKWGKGLGTRALSLWIDRLFNTLPLVRVGFTTWSGNKRMMAVGEKLGMTLEASIRKVRLYNDCYYDSIRYGLLREEWQTLKEQ